MPTPSSPSPTSTSAPRSRYGGALLELSIDQTAEVRRGLLLRCRELVGAKRRANGSIHEQFLDNDLRETQHVLRQIDAQVGGGDGQLPS